MCVCVYQGQVLYRCRVGHRGAPSSWRRTSRSTSRPMPAAPAPYIYLRTNICISRSIHIHISIHICIYISVHTYISGPALISFFLYINTYTYISWPGRAGHQGAPSSWPRTSRSTSRPRPAVPAPYIYLRTNICIYISISIYLHIYMYILNAQEKNVPRAARCSGEPSIMIQSRISLYTRSHCTNPASVCT